MIRGGTVFDGSGAAGRELDIAVTGARIIRIAPNIGESGTEEIDARGFAVAPGFIDIHSHGDGSLDADPRAESLVRQGITTIVVGQDGSSRATAWKTEDRVPKTEILHRLPRCSRESIRCSPQ